MGCIITTITINMRGAVLIAIACLIATSVSFEESFIEEQPIGDIKEANFVQHPVQVPADAAAVLTEMELASKGPYWKWENKYKTQADGKHRLRQQWSHGKVIKKEWSLIQGHVKKASKEAHKKKASKKAHTTDLAQTQAKATAIWGRRRRRSCTRRGNIVRWVSGFRRIGRHLYRRRAYWQWRCRRYVRVRLWWALYRRNHYKHRLHGRTQYRWTGHYRRIGTHQYRLQYLYRNYNGHWRRIRSFWRLYRRNHYKRPNRWFWGRHRRIGRHLYRLRTLKRWTGKHWATIRSYWHMVHRNKYAHLYRKRRSSCRRLCYRPAGRPVCAYTCSGRRARRSRGTRAIYHYGLFRENAYYFRQGGRLPHLANRRANMARWKHNINYRNTNRRWPGFARADHFAVRWTGRVRIFRRGWYWFRICSDDGSKLWVNRRYTINNDGLHGWRCRQARRYVRGWTMIRAEMFKHGGHAGMQLAYHGPDTRNRWRVLNARGYNGARRRGTRAIYRQGGRLPHLANRRANMQRWKHNINYRNTNRRWPGFARADHFAVRWTGRVRIFRGGWYTFRICSDDGSKLWVNRRYTINNDGLHGWRCRQARRYVRGWTMIRAEMFEHGGHAGMQLAYH